MMSLQIQWTISQKTLPEAGDLDECWVSAWLMCQLAVFPWLPMLSATEARRLAGDPDDGVSDGNDRGIFDLLKGIRRLDPRAGALCKPISGMAFDEWLPQVKAGRPFAAAVMGASLPHPYTKVGHQVAIFHEPGVGLRLGDPLAPDRSTPYRISTPDARTALGSFAGAGKVTGVLFPTEAEAFHVHPLYQAPGGITQAQLDAAVAAAKTETARPLLDRIQKAHDLGTQVVKI